MVINLCTRQFSQIELECTYSVRAVYMQCGLHVGCTPCIGVSLQCSTLQFDLGYHNFYSKFNSENPMWL